MTIDTGDLIAGVVSTFLLGLWISCGVTSCVDTNINRNDLIKAKQGYYIVNPETGSTTFTNTSGINLRIL